jgi:putative FmdB family regulatory protein
MPRYNYECDNCKSAVIVFHGINEGHTDCNECGLQNVMKKMLSVPLLIKEQNVDEASQKVGELTKEYIEANRNILKQQKKNKKETYEPS